VARLKGWRASVVAAWIAATTGKGKAGSPGALTTGWVAPLPPLGAVTGALGLFGLVVNCANALPADSRQPMASTAESIQGLAWPEWVFVCVDMGHLRNVG
jgi:hypothetical protein